MNKQELENEEVRQEEKKTKKKKVRKKKTMFGHIRSIISILLVVGIIGGSYWYYAFQYRAEVEPETNRKVTNTDSVYTMEQYLKTLKRNQTVYKYACDEAEVDNDYGTYVVPGLKSTRTLKVKGDGEAEVCTSMTPQGLAFTAVSYTHLSAGLEINPRREIPWQMPGFRSFREAGKRFMMQQKEKKLQERSAIR